MLLPALIPIERQDIYEQIEKERRYQDEKWGGPAHDDMQEDEVSFVKYINEYANGHGRAASHSFRARMLKTAALAVAAIERNDRINNSETRGS